MTRKSVFLACTSALLMGVPQASAADTLQEALRTAYVRNPTLTAQRAAVRAASEEVPQARVEGRPTLDGDVTYQENVLQGEPAGGGLLSDPDRQVSAQLSAKVPLFNFGAVTQNVRAAEQRVEASRLGLRSTESELFTNVVGAYMDVLKDEAVVQLNLRNSEVMRFTVRETGERRQAGNRGPTDVAQAEARMALAESQLETASAQLISSRENYVRLVGSPPGTLSQPPVLPNMPTNVDMAVAAALEKNPRLLAARKQQTAAGYDVKVATARRYPRLNGIGGLNQYGYLGSLADNTGPRNRANEGTTAYVGVRLEMPILDGGRGISQQREARALEQQRYFEVLAAERAVVAEVRSAYATWLAAGRVVKTAQRGVDANSRVLSGLRAETVAGFRPLLDRLNAEQELLNAEVTLVTAGRDAYVAGFALLAAMGMAEARDLNFDQGVLYDPTLTYKELQRRTVGGDAGQSLIEGTSTADSPAQDAVVAPTTVPAVPQIPPEN
ncbi:TolC family outer membrane protein [Sphingomonas radiodurans]|uniref:TolC family outer membrane protein n=1 Tax=Sphingomonas radiodurans TaxID=2890321 RepID=UPI001E54FFBB|nr:TolC family outer membrane protein [Sphingomonas radiodurans]WBH14996.1 TolC family outer membrane protein [Sphingomonas radiodurans]